MYTKWTENPETLKDDINELKKKELNLEQEIDKLNENLKEARNEMENINDEYNKIIEMKTELTNEMNTNIPHLKYVIYT